MDGHGSEPTASPLLVAVDPPPPSRRRLVAAWAGVLAVALGSVLVIVRAGVADAGSEAVDGPAAAWFAPPGQLVDHVPATPTGSIGLATVLDTAAIELAEYWSVELPQRYGIEFGELAGLAPYGDEGIPPCGDDPSDPDRFHAQAFYCPAGDFVAYDAVHLMPEVYRRFGDVAPAFVLAHEWAHAAQVRAGVDAPTMVLELQADCFAGAWMAQVDDPDLAVRVADFLTDSARMFAWLGDPADTPADDRDRHGDAGQRQAAFRDGYGGGGVRCVVYSSGLPVTVAGR